MQEKTREYFKAVLFGLFVFITGGIFTALIPNPFFIRMIPPNILDYVFLFTTSAFSSVFFYFYSTAELCNSCHFGNASSLLAGVFSFSCPVCSKLLILLFGYAGVISYFEPIRPYLGVLSIAIALLTLFHINKIRKENGAKNLKPLNTKLK